MILVALFWTFCILLICDLLVVCGGIAGYRSLDITSEIGISFVDVLQVFKS